MTDDYETLDVSSEENVLKISLDRPEVHNAMNESLMKELIDCFQEIREDDDIRAVVLTGKGKSFCAGADLNWMKEMVDYSKEENIESSRTLVELYDSIYSCPKPVLGRINGPAFGGGLGLIATCDVNIVVSDVKFGFSEANIGLIPSVISTYVGKRIGGAKMRHLFITGERFDSNYGKEIGLFDFVVPSNELDPTIDEYIEKVKSSSPRAVWEVKNLIEKYDHLNEKDYKDFTVEKISELRVSEEGQEGINAFLEKREPAWRE
ncbi:MAG: enoyl-CoA hydratase-related protein [Candidatus Thermoplasmatota archaeon]